MLRSSSATAPDDASRPFVRIDVPCQWAEVRNDVDGGMPVRGMRAVMCHVFDPVTGNEVLWPGVYQHKTGAFHPLEEGVSHAVDRTAERDRMAEVVLDHIWKIPFREEDGVTSSDYNALFQSYMMIFSGGECTSFATVGPARDGGPNKLDLEMLKVARLGNRQHVYARPNVIVWRDSVARME